MPLALAEGMLLMASKANCRDAFGVVGVLEDRFEDAMAINKKSVSQ